MIDRLTIIILTGAVIALIASCNIANATPMCPQSWPVHMPIWIDNSQRPALAVYINGTAHDMVFDSGAYGAWPGYQIVAKGTDPQKLNYCSGNYCASELSWYAPWPDNGLIGPHWLQQSGYTAQCFDVPSGEMRAAKGKKCPTNWPYKVKVRHLDGSRYYWMPLVVNGKKFYGIFDTGSSFISISGRYAPDKSQARICAGNLCSTQTTHALSNNWDWTNALLGWPWMRNAGISAWCLDTKRMTVRAR